MFFDETDTFTSCGTLLETCPLFQKKAFSVSPFAVSLETCVDFLNVLTFIVATNGLAA